MQLTQEEIPRLSPDERLSLIAQRWDSLERTTRSNGRRRSRPSSSAVWRRSMMTAPKPSPGKPSKPNLSNVAPKCGRFRFTEAARAELSEAQDWYEAEAPGLGRRFRAEIDSVVQRMADNPRQFPVVYKTLRRAGTKRFPYALFFLTTPDFLLIVARFYVSPPP